MNCLLRGDLRSHDPSDVLDPEVVVSEPESASEDSEADTSSWPDVSEPDRTASWVCAQSCATEVESVDELFVGQAPSLTVFVPPTDTAALPSQSPTPLSQGPPLTDILPQGPENSTRSRYGRVVRPARRFTESMVQFIPQFSVVPQSAHLLF